MIIFPAALGDCEMKISLTAMKWFLKDMCKVEIAFSAFGSSSLLNRKSNLKLRGTKGVGGKFRINNNKQFALRNLL